jgi:hypothetical protein
LPLGYSISLALSRIGLAALDRNAVQDGRQDSPRARVTIGAGMSSLADEAATTEVNI